MIAVLALLRRIPGTAWATLALVAVLACAVAAESHVRQSRYDAGKAFGVDSVNALAAQHMAVYAATDSAREASLVAANQSVRDAAAIREQRIDAGKAATAKIIADQAALSETAKDDWTVQHLSHDATALSIANDSLVSAIRTQDSTQARATSVAASIHSADSLQVSDDAKAIGAHEANEVALTKQRDARVSKKVVVVLLTGVATVAVVVSHFAWK